MAIKKNLKLDNGIFVKDAYIRIDTVSGYKSLITISVNSYVSRELFLMGEDYIEQKIYNFTPNVSFDAQEMWTQGYKYLKSLEEYEDASDVFEQ